MMTLVNHLSMILLVVSGGKSVCYDMNILSTVNTTIDNDIVMSLIIVAIVNVTI